MKVWVYWMCVLLLQLSFAAFLFRGFFASGAQSEGEDSLKFVIKAEVVLGRGHRFPAYVYQDSAGREYALSRNDLTLYRNGLRSKRDVFASGSEGREMLGRYVYIEDFALISYLLARLVALYFWFVFSCYIVGLFMGAIRVLPVS